MLACCYEIVESEKASCILIRWAARGRRKTQHARYKYLHASPGEKVGPRRDLRLLPRSSHCADRPQGRPWTALVQQPLFNKLSYCIGQTLAADEQRGRTSSRTCSTRRDEGQPPVPVLTPLWARTIYIPSSTARELEAILMLLWSSHLTVRGHVLELTRNVQYARQRFRGMVTMHLVSS